MNTPAPTLPRDALAKALGGDVRLVRAFEQQARAVSETQDAVEQGVAATDALADASFLTLSGNTALTNERVLRLGPSLKGSVEAGTFDLDVSDEVPHVQGGFTVNLVAEADVTLVLPLEGALATQSGAETLSNKTIAAPRVTGIADFADDAAAATGGVPVTGLYRTGSVLKVRVA